MEPLIHLGAKPVFIDVDDTYVMDLDQVEAAITPRTVGIIPVYIYGHPVDVDKLMAIAAKYHLWVIEDCAQSQGAKYKGKTVGSIGDFGRSAFSHPRTWVGQGIAVLWYAMIRVWLPQHLRTLAQVAGEVEVEVEGQATQRSVLDAIEGRYPMLRGTMRDQVTGQRRPFVRFFACEEDLSYEPPDAPLPEAVAKGAELFLVVGAIAGG